MTPTPRQAWDALVQACARYFDDPSDDALAAIRDALNQLLAAREPP